MARSRVSSLVLPIPQSSKMAGDGLVEDTQISPRHLKSMVHLSENAVDVGARAVTRW